ncbi:MAG: hypothetical protein K6T81_07890 [Alicyclobacillus macrosporangiidus]|uniref:hypothetical protein n=1 Tax=Alicyclobacillus macrosporangiidus TaxID=392015 RepID=UPI0026F3300C|nr:hypothetical protein [Alicyclobacillus macrosporangiidus]MCL6598646.1 hypothetical protein [Alicyclobacillus macrosporangiidus]
MSAWKIWLTTAVLVVLLGTAALFFAVWNNIDSEWRQETAAAQYALDHSPIDRIDGHDLFTGAGVQEVFTGKDVFGRRWYAFVMPAPRGEAAPFVVKSVQADEVMPANEIARRVAKDHLRVTSAHVGYVDPQSASAFHADSGVVWEVEATDTGDHRIFLYYDGRSGNLLWTSGPLQGQDPGELWKEVLST